MSETKTHRLVSKPQVSARYLADFMAATRQGERSIIRGCKYRPIARLIQHRVAKNIIGTYLRLGKEHLEELIEQAHGLRDRMASDDFDRELLDNNADYVERFAHVASGLVLPAADLTPPGDCPPLVINGTTVTVDLCFRLRRTVKNNRATNKIRVGAATLRYARGKPLPPEVGAWQSAILMGYLGQDALQDNAQPEGKLCLTIDAYLGICHPAPTDAVRRFKNIQAACATIAESWDNVAPPAGAIL